MPDFKKLEEQTAFGPHRRGNVDLTYGTGHSQDELDYLRYLDVQVQNQMDAAAIKREARKKKTGGRAKSNRDVQGGRAKSNRDVQGGRAVSNVDARKRAKKRGVVTQRYLDQENGGKARGGSVGGPKRKGYANGGSVRAARF